MGVRLYPATKDRKKLERLANVPFGTFDRLDTLVKEHGSEDAFYSVIFNDAQFTCNKLHNFLIFGWGKFKPTSRVNDCCGSTKVMDAIREVLRINEIWITLADLNEEGINWS